MSTLSSALPASAGAQFVAYASSQSVTVSIPNWVLGALVVAFAATFGAWMFAVALHWVFSFLVSPMNKTESMLLAVKAFFIIGLPVGFASAAIWHFAPHWVAVVIGILLFTGSTAPGIVWYLAKKTAHAPMYLVRLGLRTTKQLVGVR